MKRIFVAMTLSLLCAASAWSQPYGMGPGMMGGQGYGYGMGPGMMWGQGYGCYADENLKLTNEQNEKLTQIQKETRSKQWALMDKMHESGWRRGGYRNGNFDEQADRKAFDEMTEIRKQMFENSLQARKRMDQVLTPQQRKRLNQCWGGRQ